MGNNKKLTRLFIIFHNTIIRKNNTYISAILTTFTLKY
ncbi:hypothetical protein SAMN06265371_103260 [Lutibacter agarilyticus]|uniref:Uncharacterized protein n=1 Tax=Lutibacter agarilyticus TaxID=1109740 RepID=A0A238WJB8_9FLAO|nr:hypothetical protein SAMN06265371_103260 [Lutibacter agarilyticus]